MQSDQTFYADTYLSFTDYLGNRRITALFSSVSSFSNFDFQYLDLSRACSGRRASSTTGSSSSRRMPRPANHAARQRGVHADRSRRERSIYPLDLYHRFAAELSG